MDPTASLETRNTTPDGPPLTVVPARWDVIPDEANIARLGNDRPLRGHDA